MKKVIAVFTALCLASSLTACGTGGGTSPDNSQDSGSSNDNNNDNNNNNNNNGEMSAMSVELKEENFKELGRTYYADDKIYCALSGTGVEFTFTGTACSVTVEGDGNSTNSSQEDSHARVAVYVNGERVVDDMIDNAEETYEVFKSDTEQSVDVKIIKLSESPHSTFAISDISVAGGEVKPAADRDMLIEFVGDSITCGYGVDDEVKEHNFSTKTEDVTKAYAYKTAELMNADYSMVSFSGYGIISGYSDGETKVSAQTVPQYYTKLGYSWSSNDSFTPSDIEWDFSKRQPDVIVINLGTNDDSYCKSIVERCEEFQDEYVNFLKVVREHNPDATIIGALGIMGNALGYNVESAINQYSEETGDTNVAYLAFKQQSQRDGLAADWHPTETTHGKAAELLVEKIKEVKGWS